MQAAIFTSEGPKYLTLAYINQADHFIIEMITFCSTVITLSLIIPLYYYLIMINQFSFH